MRLIDADALTDARSVSGQKQTAHINGAVDLTAPQG